MLRKKSNLNHSFQVLNTCYHPASAALHYVTPIYKGNTCLHLDSHTTNLSPFLTLGAFLLPGPVEGAPPGVTPPGVRGEASNSPPSVDPDGDGCSIYNYILIIII